MGFEEFSSRFLGLIVPICVVISISTLSFSEANKFNVGGQQGWVTKPSEDYQHWAQRNRFHVNDTICFKYKKGSDSVMLVNKNDYDSCNTTSPMQHKEDGDSCFILDKSGPFYFITRNHDNCVNGQKLTVVVMAVRGKPATPSPAQPTPPATPALSPKAQSPSPSPTIISPAPSDGPAPAPTPGGSTRLGGSVGGLVVVALGVSIGVNLIFSGIIGGSKM